MLIGGLDIGTTGCKLSLYNEQGEYVCNSYKEYDINRSDGAHEIDAEMIFSSVCEVIKKSAQVGEIAAIGITSFGETFAALDENDRVLLPSMLYTDPRGAEECEWLCENMGENRLTYISGVKPHPMYSLPKIMWIKNNRPEIYSRIKRILLIEDYIVYMLTGVAQIDYSLAARTMAFDIRKKRWSREILEAAGIDPALLSSTVPTGSVAGRIKSELAEKLKINSDLQVVNIAHDQVASAVGAGAFEVGSAVDGSGTVECITPIFDSIPEDPDMYKDGYCVVPYVFENTYVCYALSFTGGAALKWFRDNFASKYEGASNVYAELDKAVAAEPTGILVLPHFAGAATPYMDNSSKAAIVGLTLEHTSADLYKAIMEGVAYEMKINTDKLASFGICPQKLYATGGGANSDVWLQIKADVLGKPFTAMQAREVGACGSCMLTGVAVGIFKDIYEARNVFVKKKGTVEPNGVTVKKYEQLYNRYCSLYGAVRPIVEEEKI